VTWVLPAWGASDEVGASGLRACVAWEACREAVAFRDLQAFPEDLRVAVETEGKGTEVERTSEQRPSAPKAPGDVVGADATTCSQFLPRGRMGSPPKESA